MHVTITNLYQAKGDADKQIKMINLERHFLGWDAPATVKVRDFLLPQELAGPVELGRDLIVVPTRQAGRRLREALAIYCFSQKTAPLSLRTVTPPFLLQPEDDSGNIAGLLEMAAVWADILMKVDLSRCGGLFPSHVPSQDFLWALHTGEMIKGLRDTLTDGGYSITAVYEEFGDILEEIQRWYDLAELESAYLERLSQIGLKDPIAEMLRYVKSTEPPKGVERIVIAAVPDPTPLMIQKLEQLSSQIPIVILIHAPESLSDCFDAWGRPLPAKWRERQIDIPDPDSNILLSGSPRSQSRKVLELIAGETGRFGPADVALGAPDGEVIPFLETDMAGAGLVPFNPAGKSTDQHPLSQLLRAFRDLLSDGDYPAVSAFLRNSDVLDYLQQKNHILPDRLLQELDTYQNEHLPQSLDDMVRVFKQSSTAEARRKEFPNLTEAIGFLEEQVHGFDAADVDSSLRSFLQTIYEFRTVDNRKPQDSEFATVAGMIDDALHLMAESPLAGLNLDREGMLEMLLWHLSGQRYYPEPEDAVIDLEGWLELPWNDAPFMIVTGMNDGSVPYSRPDDIFLPDTLRRQLKLRYDDDRLATDAYLMTALIESRREQGRVCFISGKTGSTGDVLKPSRLLFQCSDAELPHRAQRLFGTPPEVLDSYPSSISFLLEAAPPPDIPAYRLEMKSISVTAFRDYLDCPFRFYLKRMLDMEELDDQKIELDALDFGTLVHDVLYQMACDEEMRQCENVARLQDFLCAGAEEWIKDRLGSSPPLQVEAQIESAKQRLCRAAHVQAGLVRQGWEMINWEMKNEGEMEGMIIRGKIDRIDRHRQTGRVRVLDYKTSEKASKPEEVHFGPLSKDREWLEYTTVEVSGRQRRWADLQLPLYAILLSSSQELQEPFELGYFNLPRAINDTGVVLWEDFSADMLGSADRCARGVINDIRNRRFWPPSPKTWHDDFEKLFVSYPALCINAESFEVFMNQGRMI